MIMEIRLANVQRRAYVVSGYANKLQRLMLGNQTLMDVACDIREIAPKLRMFHPPALFNDKDLDRITGFGMGGTLAFERERVRAQWRDHPPTLAYTVRDLLLHRGSLYKGRFKYGVGVGKVPWIGVGRAPFTSGGVLVQSWLGSRFFGHWLIDDVPLALASSALGQAVGIRRPMTAQQMGYASLFGVEFQELPETAYLDELVVLDDRSLNSYKRERWQKMRATIRARVGTSPHAGVMLLRGNTGQERRLVNEDEVATHLSAKGFKIVDPATESLATVLQAVTNAKVVVGVEGSHLAHGLQGVAEGGVMLVLQPPFRFSNAHKDYCDALGIKYAFLVGTQVSGGFVIKLDALDCILLKIF